MLLTDTLPELGKKPEDNVVQDHLLDICMNLNKQSMSTRYYGGITGGCAPAALLADLYVSTLDQNVDLHMPRETLAICVENAALNMLLDLFYLPRRKWGVGSPYNGCGLFTTGAIASTVIGLDLGREWALSQAALERTDKVLSVAEHGIHRVMSAGNITRFKILSTLPHAAIAKAASIIGLGRSSIVDVRAVGKPFEADMRKLKEEITRPDEASVLVISLCDPITGRFTIFSRKQWARLRCLCDDYKIWIHVDGEIGLFGRLLISEDNSYIFHHLAQACRCIQFADSIAGDAHGFLNAPYDCGFFFTRHQNIATDVFRSGDAAYLASPAASVGLNNESILSPLNIGIENSRRFRALPVYANLYAYGRLGYTDLLKRQITLARKIAAWIYDHPIDYELLPRCPVDASSDAGSERVEMLMRTFVVVLFRAAESKQCHANWLVDAINATGSMYVDQVEWEGRPAARIAVSNWQVNVARDFKVVKGVLEASAKCAACRAPSKREIYGHTREGSWKSVEAIEEQNGNGTGNGDHEEDRPRKVDEFGTVVYELEDGEDMAPEDLERILRD